MKDKMIIFTGHSPRHNKSLIPAILAIGMQPLLDDNLFRLQKNTEPPYGILDDNFLNINYGFFDGGEKSKPNVKRCRKGMLYAYLKSKNKKLPKSKKWACRRGKQK